MRLGSVTAGQSNAQVVVRAGHVGRFEIYMWPRGGGLVGIEGEVDGEADGQVAYRTEGRGRYEVVELQARRCV